MNSTVPNPVNKPRRARSASPTSISLEEGHEEKMTAIIGFAWGNKLRVSGATVIRTLIEMAEPSADLLAKLRAVDEREKTLYRTRRGSKA